MNNLIYFLIICIYCGCHSQQATTDETVHISETLAKDIEIPKNIFETIVQAVHVDSPSAEPVYLFQSLEVIFESDQKSVIPQKQRFKFSNGGGEVDLKNILVGQGSFYFYFPIEQFEKLPELEHLYYMSEYPKKNIDNEIFGLGCGQWMDLKNKFSDFTKPQKIILNTTAERYLHVSAGYYIFVFRKNNQVYLTHLHVLDSRYEDSKCPRKRTSQSEATHESK